jgi:transcriptional regulator with PAS, ATPase and Fis domain
MATLRMQVPGKGVKVYHIYKKITSLGRGEEADITLADPGLAESHAHILFDGRDFNIATTERDAELYVNGRKRNKHRLAHEDRVRLGVAELEFSLYDEPVTDETAAQTMAELNSYKKLVDFSQKLMASYELPTLLDQLLDVMIQVSNADKGFLVLMESGEPVVKVARNLRRETLTDAVSQLSDSILARVVKTRKPIIISDALSDDEFKNSLSVVNLKLTSVMCVPLLERGNMLGVIYVGNDNVAQLFDESHLEVLTIFAAQASLLIRNALLVNELQLDKRSLVEQIERIRFGEILGSSARMQEVFRKVQKVATTDISVLVTGETGTGKELIARELHNRSQRAKGPFITINCGAIPENLLESELFGHVRGAFTGAVTTKTGRFQAANHGTLFLDEIGEMPIALQVKILRALQERVVVKVGDTATETVDIRVLAATNRDLEAEIKAGRARPRRRHRGAGPLHGEPLRARVRRQGEGPHAQRHRRHQAPPLARQHPRAGEPHQEGRRAGGQGAPGPRGPRPLARRPADDPPPGRRQGEVPARLHQRDPRAERRQPHEDGPRPGRRPAHRLSSPREGGRRHGRAARRGAPRGLSPPPS